MNEEICTTYEQGWLKMMLDLVNVTKSDATKDLVTYFSEANSQALKKHHSQITDHVRTSWMAVCSIFM